MMTTSLLLLLQVQLKQLVQMNALLLLEREAFTSRSPEKVKAATEQKTAALKQLQDTDNQISSTYTAKDFENNEIKPLKIELDNALAELKTQNEVNGKILQNNQINVKMLKDILIGSKKDRSSMTYDQAGQKSSSLRSRPIKA
jgi:flagellar biosynthesis/type III secretory pathway chaperone